MNNQLSAHLAFEALQLEILGDTDNCINELYYKLHHVQYGSIKEFIQNFRQIASELQ